MSAHHSSLYCIIPPYLLRSVAENGTETQKRAARRTLWADDAHRTTRSETKKGQRPAKGGGTPLPKRTVFDCEQKNQLSGAKKARSEGEGPTGDLEVDEAYDGLGATHALLWQAFSRNSIDGAGMPMRAYVHYGVNYENAFWDGEQMVFGDGDGVSFNRFTIAVDVVGHELAHGVLQHEANLDYSGQSGALNESVADVFGSMVKQHTLQQKAREADWLIGEGLLKTEGAALRSMKEPGTAYDDPVLGKDPQPGHMSDYVETDDDNGGVHVNSGIPNRAFYLASTKIGGHTWEGAGKIWYQTISDNSMSTSVDFSDFASGTLEKAESIFGARSREVEAVQKAWESVGVLEESHG